MSDANTNGGQFHAEAMHELRMRILKAPPADYGIEPSSEYPRVYGVVMDWPLGEHIATVVSLCDGNTSLYTTSTFGIIGGHGYEAVRDRARAFVKAADQYYDDASATSEFPYPNASQVRFYLLTFDGVRVTEASLEDVIKEKHRYAPLFFQGQEVLTELRLIMDHESKDEGTTGPHRKELSGVPGYLHCLLTAMSEGLARSIVLHASKPVPNLVELAVDNDDLRGWIEAQEFPYDALESISVIRLLKQSAKIKGLPFLTRRAVFPTLLAQEDRSLIAHVFDISLSPFDRSATIDLAPQDDPRVEALQRKTDAKHAS